MTETLKSFITYIIRVMAGFHGTIGILSERDTIENHEFLTHLAYKAIVCEDEIKRVLNSV